ncbi:unnamed protein product [Brassicogethes aeneus]|uniref:Uncharacterized protein n=1 Tax=Brassicogethes aeneus TaxID=1431903 RepID=A0A9P0FM64_BRAAE|nr:unnamed protein product [Brassicogethes aeneus]
MTILRAAVLVLVLLVVTQAAPKPTEEGNLVDGKLIVTTQGSAKITVEHSNNVTGPVTVKRQATNQSVVLEKSSKERLSDEVLQRLGRQIENKTQVRAERDTEDPKNISIDALINQPTDQKATLELRQKRECDDNKNKEKSKVTSKSKRDDDTIKKEPVASEINENITLTQHEAVQVKNETVAIDADKPKREVEIKDKTTPKSTINAAKTKRENEKAMEATNFTVGVVKPRRDVKQAKNQTDIAASKPKRDVKQSKNQTDIAASKPKRDVKQAKNQTDIAASKPKRDVKQAKNQTDIVAGKPKREAVEAKNETVAKYAANPTDYAAAKSKRETVEAKNKTAPMDASQSIKNADQKLKREAELANNEFATTNVPQKTNIMKISPRNATKSKREIETQKNDTTSVKEVLMTKREALTPKNETNVTSKASINTTTKPTKTAAVNATEVTKKSKRNDDALNTNLTRTERSGNQSHHHHVHKRCDNANIESHETRKQRSVKESASNIKPTNQDAPAKLVDVSGSDSNRSRRDINPAHCRCGVFAKSKVSVHETPLHSKIFPVICEGQVEEVQSVCSNLCKKELDINQYNNEMCLNVSGQKRISLKMFMKPCKEIDEWNDTSYSSLLCCNNHKVVTCWS